jgi:DNA-binding NarL/FixJ family response regulator
MASVVFLSSDLMFFSRLEPAARAAAMQLKQAANPTALANVMTDDCRLVLIDLSLAGLNLPNAVAEIRRLAPAARIVAFGAHVNEAALAAAAEAGCDLVMSRGQFNKQYGELIAEVARPAGS